MADLSTIFNASDRTAPGYYKASETALLLLDFHGVFIPKAGSDGSNALANAAKLRNWAKSQHLHVIHALVDVNGTPFPTCKGAERLVRYIAELKQAGNTDEPPELTHGSNAHELTFIRAPGYVSALKSPGLDDHLQKTGIKSLVLCGLSTSGCVMRTALAATDAEYVVSVISDACADAAEGVHEMVTGKLVANRSYVMTTAEFQSGFDEAAKKG